MQRRRLVVLSAAAAIWSIAWTLAWPIDGVAQQVPRVYRIGYLSAGSSSADLMSRDEAFRQALRELGYIEGRNLIIESRFAEGKFDRLPNLAAELVRLKVDVIVSVVTQASVAAKAATDTIPIVMAAVSDPLGAGLIASLARPGANVTGTSSMTSELVGKTLELLKEVVPSASRIAVLWNPDNTVFQSQMLREAERTAALLRLEPRVFGAGTADELERAFPAIAEANVGALVVLADPNLAQHRQRIVEFAERSRLPAVYGTKDFAPAGGLMTYSADMAHQFRGAASYVDKILKGAKPADLPVQQATRFEFVANMKTAKVLGLTIPLPLLGRADEVIE